MSMSRRILGVVAGIAVGFILVMIGDMCSCIFAPVLKGIDPKNKQATEEIMKQVPIISFLVMLLGYALGAFLGGCVATMITGRTALRPAMIVGIVLTIGNVLNQMEIPHPMWFEIVSTLIYIPLAWLGYNVLKPKA